MRHVEKYTKNFYAPLKASRKWVEKDCIEKPPIWCSVDLRDGNQALITPMSLEEKIEFFQLLVKVGFKEIEVGFPAASETESVRPYLNRAESDSGGCNDSGTDSGQRAYYQEDLRGGQGSASLGCTCI